MLTSIALIFTTALISGKLFKSLKLPAIIGMLLSGIIIGPYALNLLDSSILSISSDLRRMALIIILIKAGLSLNLKDLKQVGRPALLMSFVPALMEIAAFTIFAPYFLNISKIEAALTGAVIGAVSPAVVVPRMVNLIEKKWGTNKSIPQLILAGASMDDVFVIVLFTSFLSMAQGAKANLMDFVNIPVSIILGIFTGIVTGLFLAKFFNLTDKTNKMRASIKVIIMLCTAFFLMTVEKALSSKIGFSGLIAIMTMAASLKIKIPEQTTILLSSKFGKLWLPAEMLLFVLVGAATDIRFTLEAGPNAAVMILISLLFRAAGVCICMTGTELSLKEKLFCVLSYLPKATVQAAIGGVPLAMGLSCGKTVLSVAVIAIIITAPLGAFCIDYSYKKLLSPQTDDQ